MAKLNVPLALLKHFQTKPSVTNLYTQGCQVYNLGSIFKEKLKCYKNFTFVQITIFLFYLDVYEIKKINLYDKLQQNIVS